MELIVVRDDGLSYRLLFLVGTGSVKPASDLVPNGG